MKLMLMVLLLACVARCETVDARTDGGPVPDPASAGSPDGLDLTALGTWMNRWLDRAEGPIAPRLRALLEHWHLAPTVERWAEDEAELPMLPVAEADLDGDGRMEAVTALSVPYEIDPRRGALFVVMRAGAGHVRVVPWYPVDPARGREWLPSVVIAAAADMRGTGRAEIVWFTPGSGACNNFIDVHVSAWTGGRLEQLGAALSVVAPRRVLVDSGELVVEHDYEGCAAAGGTARGGTERYRLDGERLRLIDQRFSPSRFSYHRLIDGVNAESFGRVADALVAYAEASEPGRAALPEEAGAEADESASLKALPAAVRAFARFRHGALLIQRGDAAKAAQVVQVAEGQYADLPRTLLGAVDRPTGCRAADAWIAAHPGFLAALNAPSGWAHYEWRPHDVCGPLPGDETSTR